MFEIELRYVEVVERAWVVYVMAIVGDGGFVWVCELVTQNIEAVSHDLVCRSHCDYLEKGSSRR